MAEMMENLVMTNVTEYDANLKLFEKEIVQGPRISYSIQLKLYDILVPLVAGLIIILNLLVVCSSGLILKKRQQPRSTYIFLGNIALADMLTGVSTLIGQYYPKDIRTEMMCCIQIGMIISATLASIYSIALIAVDRYLYILYGLKYKQYLSSKRARFMVLMTWIIGIFVGFLPAMGIRNSTDSGRFCWLIILEPTPLILSTVMVGVMPLFLIIILYGIILKKALGKISEMKSHQNGAITQSDDSKRQLRYFRGNSNKLKNSTRSAAIVNTEDGTSDKRISYIQEEVIIDETTNSKRSFFNCCRRSTTLKISSVYSPSRWKAIKIVVFTAGCFFVTWVPYFLACALYVVCEKDGAPKYCNSLRVAIASPLAILGLANSLLNPIIYAWWHNGFRESAKNIYNNIWRQRIRPIIPFTKKDSKNEINSSKEIKSENSRDKPSHSTSISASTASSSVEGSENKNVSTSIATEAEINTVTI
ncbi:glucose-dependent insulinotropic receptor-like [Teleopsis dalmanni]|uniref:glucose-dependent insulinotropic receptor-like n=1 Tax=Teleopsis dalmanni TaxID=139649 RepID=UPI0018CCD7B3|nr:glucose-dependent insulinotropic receptor-like [Teleopsis dalmanni]